MFDEVPNIMRQSLRDDLLLAAGLVAVAVAGRLLGQETGYPNFNPVASAAMFAGFACSRRWAGLLVAPAAMLLSDAVIGLYDWRMMAVVYAALTAPVGLGWLMQGRLNVGWVVGGAAGSSLLFFQTTNFAVWAADGHGMYPHTAAGLLSCYAAGLPFLKGTLAGDLCWSAFLFGGYALSEILRPAAEQTFPFLGRRA